MLKPSNDGFNATESIKQEFGNWQAWFCLHGNSCEICRYTRFWFNVNASIVHYQMWSEVKG